MIYGHKILLCLDKSIAGGVHEISLHHQSK